MEADGTAYCDLPIKRETLPNGRYYDIVDLGDQALDWYGPIKLPSDHPFIMGANRDRSAYSRVSMAEDGIGVTVTAATLGGSAQRQDERWVGKDGVNTRST